MSESIRSLIDCGTKLWLDSIDPVLVTENKAMGISGATSNPIIIANLIKTGRFDDQISKLVLAGNDNETIAWALTDTLVSGAQESFVDVWESTSGNDGYVSFELDPLLEDIEADLPHAERVQQYVALGKKWSAGHKNRMIKVPATAAGLDSVEELVAAGIPLNVTLIFSDRQYQTACENVWKGAQRLENLDSFKSVFSIFVSRVDVYTEKHVLHLSEEAQGLVGIVNAQQIWQSNQDFWAGKGCPLQQEIIFASTGTKKADDPPTKYVAALAGSDIQTNPPATNVAAAESGLLFSRLIDVYPSDEVLDCISRHVDFIHLEETLMREGTEKFADPHKGLLQLIEEKRAAANA